MLIADFSLRSWISFAMVFLNYPADTTRPVAPLSLLRFNFLSFYATLRGLSGSWKSLSICELLARCYDTERGIDSRRSSVD